MSEAEQQTVFNADNPALAFTRLWTMKEARLKLTGEGLAHRLKTVLEEPGFRFETGAADTFLWALCEAETNSQTRATFSL